VCPSSWSTSSFETMTSWGGIPSCLGELPNLQGLELGTNQLTGTLPESLCELTQLLNLVLYANRFEGTIPTCFG